MIATVSSKEINGQDHIWGSWLAGTHLQGM
jgi:hypothetical protein